jgi:hypothetical protein
MPTGKIASRRYRLPGRSRQRNPCGQSLRCLIRGGSVASNRNRARFLFLRRPRQNGRIHAAGTLSISHLEISKTMPERRSGKLFSSTKEEIWPREPGRARIRPWDNRRNGRSDQSKVTLTAPAYNATYESAFERHPAPRQKKPAIRPVLLVA